VATFHTSHFLMRAQKARWRWILGQLVRAPDYVLAASSEIASVASDLASGTRVEPLTNGVETSVFRRVSPTIPLGDRPRILVPRRLFPKNGVEQFVRALPLILDEIDVEAVVVGDGPEGEHLRGIAEELELADRIRFLGKRPHHEMPGLLSSGTVVVIPSLMEATSVAALEAMACEVPVAASRVGGLPEIVDDQVGALFRAGDSEDLARAVVQLLSAPDLAERGARGRERVVAHWSNERLAARHLEIYEAVLQRRA
jgi:glycosyltransferase involved in cell wall biosynthesis